MSALSGLRGRRIAAGAIGGVAGLVVMQLVQKLSPVGPKHHPDEGATDAIARIAYTKLVGHEPSPKLKTVLSWGVHIASGLAAAAVYGLVRGARGRNAVRDGIVFGAALWLAGDELAMPLLGLADKPIAYSPSQHAQMLAEHLGFGIASTVTTRYLEDPLS